MVRFQKFSRLRRLLRLEVGVFLEISTFSFRIGSGELKVRALNFEVQSARVVLE